MHYNEQLADRIRVAFEAFDDVEEKSMFNGLVFMVNGKMCVGARSNDMMCRINPELHDEAVEREGCTEMVHGGRVMRGFVFVELDALKTTKSFDYWIGLALAYNKIAKAAKKKKK